MRLENVEIEGFRSVIAPMTLRLRPTLTCLVGPNEHGKSNLLDAIDKLDGGAFEDDDRFVGSTDEELPRLSYHLRMSTKERTSFLRVLATAIAALQEASTSTAAATLASLQRAREHLSQSSEEVLTVSLEADNARSIDLGEERLRIENDYFHPTSTLVDKWFEESVPAVRLFAPTANLVDTITLAELESGKNPPFEGLLKLGDVWEDRAAIFGGNTEATRLQVRAGRLLTKRLRRIWSQGARHTLHLHESSGKLAVTIEDPSTHDEPSKRSLGFRSFLSFYLTLFSETQEIDPEGYIFLFDEPGIHLHPRGQKDLLRQMRRVAERNQIVYTTHSPFMIDRNDLASTILVKKGVAGGEKGTRVMNKPYSANWTPLNAALGITPSDQFFPADAVLLVEGTSDHMYIQTYMALCQARTKADLNDLYILDGDIRDEVEAFVRFLVAADRSILVVGDADKGGEDWEKQLRKAARRRAELLSFVDLRAITGLKKPVSIEDVLPQEQWFDAVDDYLRLILRADANLDRVAVATRAKLVTLGRATADYLTDQGLIRRPGQFSKTTVADLYIKRGPSVPEVDAPISRLCMRITKALAIGPT